MGSYSYGQQSRPQELNPKTGEKEPFLFKVEMHSHVESIERSGDRKELCRMAGNNRTGWKKGMTSCPMTSTKFWGLIDSLEK